MKTLFKVSIFYLLFGFILAAEVSPASLFEVTDDGSVVVLEQGHLMTGAGVNIVDPEFTVDHFTIGPDSTLWVIYVGRLGFVEGKNVKLLVDLPGTNSAVMGSPMSGYEGPALQQAGSSREYRITAGISSLFLVGLSNRGVSDIYILQKGGRYFHAAEIQGTITAEAAFGDILYVAMGSTIYKGEVKSEGMSLVPIIVVGKGTIRSICSPTSGKLVFVADNQIFVYDGERVLRLKDVDASLVRSCKGNVFALEKDGRSILALGHIESLLGFGKTAQTTEK